MRGTGAQMIDLRFGRRWIEQLVMSAVFIIFLKPAWVGTLPGIGSLWAMAQLGLLFCLLVLVSVNRLSEHSCLILIFAGLFLTSAYINGVSLVETLQMHAPYIGMALICDLWMRSGRGQQMIRVLCRVLIAYVYINFLTVLLFPQGLYTSITSDGISRVKCWFLGYKNPQIRVLLPALAMLAILKWNGRKRCISLHFLLTALVVLTTVIMVDSMTSVLAVLMFLGLLMLFSSDRSKLIRLFSPKLVLCYFVLTTMLIAIVQNYSILSEIMVLLFPDRNISTLSARTYVWDAALEIIRKHWLLGQGTARFFTQIGWGVTHPHNYLLYYWIIGGIGAVAALLALWYITLNRVYAQRTRFVGRMLLAVILTVFMMGIVEALTEFPVLYAMTAVAFHLDRLADTEFSHAKVLFVQNRWTVIW